MVEVVKGLLGKEILELLSSSSEVSPSKSQVRNRLRLPGTGWLGPLWWAECEDIVKRRIPEICAEGIGFVERIWILSAYIYLQFLYPFMKYITRIPSPVHQLLIFNGNLRILNTPITYMILSNNRMSISIIALLSKLTLH